MGRWPELQSQAAASHPVQPSSRTAVIPWRRAPKLTSPSRDVTALSPDTCVCICICRSNAGRIHNFGLVPAELGRVARQRPRPTLRQGCIACLLGAVPTDDRGTHKSNCHCRQKVGLQRRRLSPGLGRQHSASGLSCRRLADFLPPWRSIGLDVLVLVCLFVCFLKAYSPVNRAGSPQDICKTCTLHKHTNIIQKLVALVLLSSKT